jgi:hypothetical protein
MTGNSLEDILSDDFSGAITPDMAGKIQIGGSIADVAHTAAFYNPTILVFDNLIKRDGNKPAKPNKPKLDD